MWRYGNENEANARMRNNKSTLHGLRLSSPVLYLYYFNIGFVRETALGELKGRTKAKQSRCYRKFDRSEILSRRSYFLGNFIAERYFFLGNVIAAGNLIAHGVMEVSDFCSQ